MDTTAATMHPAEEYLRNEQNPPVLYVRIYGERRKLFINRGGENVIGIIAKGKRKHGYIFSDWNSIEKIYYPSQEKEDEKDMDRKMILKYQKLARLATHTNDWLRKIAAADLEKSLYENRITTGTAIDGKCIRLSTIEKYCGSWVKKDMGEIIVVVLVLYVFCKIVKGIFGGFSKSCFRHDK